MLCLILDTCRITASIRNKVEKLLAAKAQSFEKEVIYRASQAAGPMATWVKANIAFAKVCSTAPLACHDFIKLSCISVMEHTVTALFFAWLWL